MFDVTSPVINNNNSIKVYLYFNCSWLILYQGILCTYQRPSWRDDPGDIQGNSAGFADFCRQFLAQNGGIGLLLHFRGKIHGERPTGFVTSPPS